MATACVTFPQAQISLDGQRLKVVHPEDAFVEPNERANFQRQDLPIRELDRLLIAENVSITSPALTELLRRGIPVSWLDGRGQFLGAFHPAPPAHGASRLIQYRRTLDADFSMAIAERIVTAKIYNQRRVLQRVMLGRRRHLQQRQDWEQHDGELNLKESPAVTLAQLDNDTCLRDSQKAVDWLDAIVTSVRTATTTDELRGYEGAAAARYFKAWADFLPTEFPFVRRSTRPPQNAVNACISFGATMLYQEMTAAIHAQGLDPALGFLHSTENGRWSLALDLIEPFRPVLVEALALDLVSHAMLKAHDFEDRDGGVFLKANGRRTLILQYERRMERQFMSESAGHRTTLRQQLDAQVTMLKSALDDLSTFNPFLIN
jgi:CRISPR-associated protein Cas1